MQVCPPPSDLRPIHTLQGNIAESRSSLGLTRGMPPDLRPMHTLQDSTPESCAPFYGLTPFYVGMPFLL